MRHLLHLLRPFLTAKLLAVAAVLTLAIGIAATTAVFSVVHAVLIRPLPWSEAENLAMVWRVTPEGTAESGLSDRELLAYQTKASSIAAIGGYQSGGGTWTRDGGPPEGLWITHVSPTLFGTLGTQAHVGRLFVAQEYTRSPRAAILSHEFWTESLNADPGVVGREIVVDGRSIIVVGVTPPGYRVPTDYRWSGRSDVWMPAAIEPASASDVREWWAVARLKRGASHGAVRAELTAILRHTTAAADARTAVVAVDNEVRGGARPALMLAMAAAALVLIIACANLAILLVTTAICRRREFLVRLAVGASRRALASMVLREGMTLSVIGGTLGVLGALAILDVIIAVAPPNIPGVASATVDFTVLWVAGCVTIASGVAASLAPVIASIPGDLDQGLRTTGRSLSSASGSSARRWLVAAQVALAVIVLVAAGLLARSFAALGRVDPGYDVDLLLTGDLVLPETRYPDYSSRLAFYGRVRDAVAAAPGVRDAALSSSVPIWNPASMGGLVPLAIEDQPDSDRRPLEVAFEILSPQALATLGVKLIAGRDFAQTDREAQQPVALVSRGFARRLWPTDAVALEKRIKLAGLATDRWISIVGVATAECLR